ncbi:DUF421 domain-containing protein [Mucilaginibacter litoreus]|uniref:DUF421 domain-containing protein n=1 Tax=Mucilaginibacter litoreus TaxID=1048221 RepID=A0ABW3AX74_9SPHI
MSNMFFDAWDGLLRAFLVTFLGYALLVLVIRISGKRTLSKMNAFDFIVTIALGSCLASICLSKDVALAEGAVVFSTLIGLQFLITWLSVRFNRVKVIVGGQPVLLLYKGELLSQVIRKERITIQEINVACRASSIANINDVEAIVLETTGDITVISKFTSKQDSPATLKDVLRFPA